MLHRRMAGCPRCEPQPVDPDGEQVLFDMGFEPCIAGERDYRCEHLPFGAEWLSAISEVAFRSAFDEQDDFGICAIFSQPAIAEALYLARSYR